MLLFVQLGEVCVGATCVGEGEVGQGNVVFFCVVGVVAYDRGRRPTGVGSIPYNPHCAYILSRLTHTILC